MTADRSSTRSAAYESARAEFDRLRVEEKALFLVEAMFSTVGRGLEAAGETLSREMDGLFRSGGPRPHAAPADPMTPPPPPTPPGPIPNRPRRPPSGPATDTPDPNITL